MKKEKLQLGAIKVKSFTTHQNNVIKGGNETEGCPILFTDHYLACWSDKICK